MKAVRMILPLVLGLAVAGCTENTAPGNDREAHLDPPASQAEVVSAGAAIEGVATRLLFPQTMTDADLGVIPDAGNVCVFRMTRVDHPVAVYASTAVIKLNDKLVSLPTTGEGRYEADGVTVTVRSLKERAGDGKPFPAEFVLRLPDAPNELGFHGFAEC